LPPEFLRTAPRVQYIHSIENWEALERGLRAVHTKVRLAQSRMLRVSGRLQAEADDREAFFNLPIHGVPAEHFNKVFDEIVLTDEDRALARAIRRRALSVTDLEETAFLDAVRAHAAVGKLMERHQADAITIECLFLKHRKPCLSFALNNGQTVPCGCENDLNATLTLMLGASLFGRGGFQHNPEFDTEHNHYFASHCTCTTRLHGRDQKDAPYHLRPFFHQLPKTLALDVQWPSGEPVTLVKFQTGKNTLDAWRGRVLSSPTCPPAGGCATRVLASLDGVTDVCSVYSGPHPVLYCGDFARHAKVFAQLYGLELRTNV
jgi:L-fucose isomerase-like protein